MENSSRESIDMPVRRGGHGLRAFAGVLLLAIAGSGELCAPSCPAGEHCPSGNYYGMTLTYANLRSEYFNGSLCPVAVGGRATLLFGRTVPNVASTLRPPGGLVVSILTPTAITLSATADDLATLRIVDGTNGDFYRSALVSARTVATVAVKPVRRVPSRGTGGVGDGPLAILRGTTLSLALLPYDASAYAGPGVGEQCPVVDETLTVAASPSPVASIRQVDWQTIDVVAMQPGDVQFSMHAQSGVSRDVTLTVVDSIDDLGLALFGIPFQPGTIVPAGGSITLGRSAGYWVCGFATWNGQEVLTVPPTYMIDGTAVPLGDPRFDWNCTGLTDGRAATHTIVVAAAGRSATFTVVLQ